MGSKTIKKRENKRKEYCIRNGKQDKKEKKELSKRNGNKTKMKRANKR
jgi:hypothetical protein